MQGSSQPISPEVVGGQQSVCIHFCPVLCHLPAGPTFFVLDLSLKEHNESHSQCLCVQSDQPMQGTTIAGKLKKLQAQAPVLSHALAGSVTPTYLSDIKPNCNKDYIATTRRVCLGRQ
jgi:hypothetical protein